MFFASPDVMLTL